MQVQPPHQPYFSTVFLNCISQLYFPTVFQAYSKLHFLTVFYLGSTQVMLAQRPFQLHIESTGGLISLAHLLMFYENRKKPARKSSEDTQVAGNAQFEKVCAG